MTEETSVVTTNTQSTHKYWKAPSSFYMSGNGGGTNTNNNNNKNHYQSNNNGTEDMVIIHVCDENQQISRDFCCKRDILIHNMKYFQKFLTETEHGYDDIDISVHCDVEIFEWLMTFIHEPNNPPKIDKSMIVSILISSEFLQMDVLVEHCLSQMIQSLNEIIKLPIDLSCISEKLINRMVTYIHPKQLSEIKDRKDKILTKLYKRRVELDFSRKGSASKNVPSYTFITTQISRSIAASLTCCRYCGMVYLENYVSTLVCRKSPPCIDYRGRLASRHSSITGWSLTSYLKTLHAGGMGWDAIYWHVWAACIILRVSDVTISALEVDRYSVENDGLVIMKSIVKDPMEDDNSAFNSKSTNSEFSLATEDDYIRNSSNGGHPISYRMLISRYDETTSTQGETVSSTTPTLNPNRPPEVLTSEIFDLICSQMKYIVGVSHKALIQNTMQGMITSSKSTENLEKPDEYYESLWFSGGADDDEDSERRRGRSPGRPLRASSLEPRKQANGPKLRQSSPQAAASIDNGSDTNGNQDIDLLADGIAALTKKPSVYTERRSRSSSTGKRVSTINGLIKAPNSMSRERLRRGNETSRSEQASIPVSRSISSSNGQQRDEFIAKQLETLKALPPDLYYRIAQHRLPIYGIWLSPSPLQLQPVLLEDMLGVVSETNLSDNKKLEWELDLMREYDEKKMDRLERFLISKRNPVLCQSSPVKMKGMSNKGKGINPSFNPLLTGKGNSDPIYYKDRGRQPIQSIN